MRRYNWWSKRYLPFVDLGYGYSSDGNGCILWDHIFIIFIHWEKTMIYSNEQFWGACGKWVQSTLSSVELKRRRLPTRHCSWIALDGSWISLSCANRTWPNLQVVEGSAAKLVYLSSRKSQWVYCRSCLVSVQKKSEINWLAWFGKCDRCDIVIHSISPKLLIRWVTHTSFD